VRNVAASEVIGFEALARLAPSGAGFSSRRRLIPLAEESGLIVEMGEWILRRSLPEAPPGRAAADRREPVAGAIHPWRPRRPRSFEPARDRHWRPDRLELEITRRRADRGSRPRPVAAAAAEGARRAHFDGRLRQRLFLAELPAGVSVDKIKIDRAFVINLGRNPQSAAIVRAVIDLGHGLEMSIVAEGVETEAQLASSRRRGATRCRAICSAGRRRLVSMPRWSVASQIIEPVRKTG